jgi:hypothetical protein
MRFRRIYWVTEQLDESGASEVTGIFTSVHDLIDKGIGVRDLCAKRSGFRVSLVELDSAGMPLATFSSPFADARDRLQAYVESGEISEDEAVRLSEALKNC